MKKFFGVLAALVLVVSLAACGGDKKETTKETAKETTKETKAADETKAAGETKSEAGGKIRIGASITPHAEILAVVKDILAEQGIELEIIEFTDYVQPNMALESGELEANYFQHKTYMEDFNAENGTHLVSLAEVHYEPYGLYPGKTASLDDLKDGASIAIPNDGTNEARALFLLEAQGLIKLKEGTGLTATIVDIEENPKNLDIKEVEAAQIPRSLADVDMAVINGNYAIQAGFNVAKDALAIEDKESVAVTNYPNVVAVKEGTENDPNLVALKEAILSDKVKSFIEEKYEGAVIPVF